MAANGFFSGATATRGNNDHLAETCRDPACRRLPCRIWKEAYQKGYDEGYEAGLAAGYAAGWQAGYTAGFSDGTSTCA